MRLGMAEGVKEMKFVFDIDGTLCFDRLTIADRLKSALLLAGQYGHEVVFASARSYRDCIPVLGKDLSQRLVVGLNGGVAYRRGKLVAHHLLDKRSYQEALSWCHRYNLPYFVDDDFNYAFSQGEKIPFISTVDVKQLAQQLSIEALENPVKMLIYMGHHEDLIEDICHDLRQLDTLLIDYHEEEKCLYLNPKGITKASTLRELIGQDFVVFGNDKNDKEMFELSLYGIQVGDYKPLVAYADEQIEANPDLLADKIASLFEEFAGR